METHTQWTDTNIVKTQMSFTLARAAAAAKSTMAGRGCPWYQVRVDTPGDGDAGLPELFSLFNFNVMPFSGRRPATQLFSPLRSFLSRPWRPPPAGVCRLAAWPSPSPPRPCRALSPFPPILFTAPRLSHASRSLSRSLPSAAGRGWLTAISK